LSERPCVLAGSFLNSSPLSSDNHTIQGRSFEASEAHSFLISSDHIFSPSGPSMYLTSVLFCHFPHASLTASVRDLNDGVLNSLPDCKKHTIQPIPAIFLEFTLPYPSLLRPLPHGTVQFTKSDFVLDCNLFAMPQVRQIQLNRHARCVHI
jgi:hypothetical protein